MEDLWDAPSAPGPVAATVTVPGSKSMTNRALILAALSPGESHITDALVSRDTALMADALAALGVDITHGPDTSGCRSMLVRPAAELAGPTDIHCGLAGTVLRFVPPVAVLARGSCRFDGDRQARRRPISPLLDALRHLGARIDGHSLPFTVHGTGHVRGGEVTLDASESSQIVSALLLAGSRFDRGVRVRHLGPAIPSLPHIAMTLAMLRGAGARLLWDVADPADCWWQVDPGELTAGDVRIEPDLTNAAVFLAAAMITGGTVTIAHWPGRSLQPADRVRALFGEMGGRAVLSSGGLTLTGPQQVDGIDIDLRDVGELVPTLAAVCLFARKQSVLRGIGHLRGHETDRLAALACEIERLGGRAQADADTLTITPGALRAADVETYADHRMATFAAIVGLAVPGVRVRNIATTAKTLPGFPERWSRMLGVIE